MAHACYSSLWTATLLIFVALHVTLGIAGKTNFDKIGKHFNVTNKELLECLLRPDKYDNQMRPEMKTIVNVSILLLSITSPDESSVTYEIGFVMVQKWHDPRLQFQEFHDCNKSMKHVPASVYLNGLRHMDRIWLPDTYFIKHGEFKHPSDDYDPLHIDLKVFSNGSFQRSNIALTNSIHTGTVLSTRRRNMILKCEGNLRIFPFDSPKCFFGLESVSHEKDQVELRWNLVAPLLPFERMKTINAKMFRNLTNRCNKRNTWRRDYSCLSVLLVFSRDQSFYLTTVFVPGIVLVTSSFISFWLDANAVPARVMIAVTTMLNFCTTTNSFRSKLPVVSNLYAMNLWDFVCMFFIYASMIEFIIVNYLYRRHNRRRHPRGGVSRQSLSSQGENYSFRRKSIRRCTKHDFTLDLPSRDQLKTSLSGREESSTPEPELTNTSHKSPNHCGCTCTDAHPSSYAFYWEHNLVDHVSKTVFTLLFGLFTFFYFLTYAGIKPAQLEDWIDTEFESPD